MRVLNKTLYDSLQTYFGGVKLSNAGEEMISSQQVMGGVESRVGLKVEHPGEYYRVNCPHCSDTIQRLYINHRWGVRDDDRRLNLYLMVCYNENCYADSDTRRELYDILTTTTSELKGISRCHIKPGKTVNSSLEVMNMPGQCTRLDLLPPDHQACVYLAQRQYDPERLGKFYGVQYCEDSHLYLARGRIIAPVYCKGKMTGYQARPPYDCDWKATKTVKWWTGPGTPRSRVFYNYDNASKFRTGVIVEGPADVWGFGPMCHGVMGSTITRQQCQLFVRAHKYGSGILLLDPEEMQKKRTRDVISYMKGKLKYGFAAVTLPSGKDPGSLERAWARDFVYHEAKKQGVRVSWKRKSNGTS